jgi:hypothetical protein
MTTMSKLYSPTYKEINANSTGETFIGKIVTFVITGTWLVKFNDMLLMPGDVLPFDLQGAEGDIKIMPEISFVEDVSQHPSVLGNKRLKAGKFIKVMILKLN